MEKQGNGKRAGERLGVSGILGTNKDLAIVDAQKVELVLDSLVEHIDRKVRALSHTRVPAQMRGFDEYMRRARSRGQAHRQEVARLRREIEQLQGRCHELERLAKRGGK